MNKSADNIHRYIQTTCSSRVIINENYNSEDREKWREALWSIMMKNEEINEAKSIGCEMKGGLNPKAIQLYFTAWISKPKKWIFIYGRLHIYWALVTCFWEHQLWEFGTNCSIDVEKNLDLDGVPGICYYHRISIPYGAAAQKWKCRATYPEFAYSCLQSSTTVSWKPRRSEGNEWMKYCAYIIEGVSTIDLVALKAADYVIRDEQVPVKTNWHLF